MTTGHLVASIIGIGTVVGLLIYLESMLRNLRATKSAERRRRLERERQKREQR
jgi:hypothetical protein